MPDTLEGRRVLVVENEYFIASDLGRALAKAGATVVGPAGDPDRALALATDEVLDAAVLDVNLDGKTSFPVADRLSARAIPFMFLTGYDEWALPDRYRSAPRMGKPFSTVGLVAALRAMVGAVPA